MHQSVVTEGRLVDWELCGGLMQLPPTKTIFSTLKRFHSSKTTGTSVVVLQSIVLKLNVPS